MATPKTKKKPAAGSGLPVQADPVPAKVAPPPPVGFAPPPKGSRRPGPMPTEQQVRDAPDVARELTTSASYATDFSARVPPAAIIASALSLAKGWSDQLAAADLWLAYVKVQTESSWRAALALTKQFTPEFKLADAHDPAIAKTYPQTKDFLGVRSKVAARAAQTKAAKKKAAAKKTT